MTPVERDFRKPSTKRRGRNLRKRKAYSPSQDIEEGTGSRTPDRSGKYRTYQFLDELDDEEEIEDD